MTVSLVCTDSELAPQVRSSTMMFRHSDSRCCGWKFARHLQQASKLTLLNSKRLRSSEETRSLCSSFLCSSTPSFLDLRAPLLKSIVSLSLSIKPPRFSNIDARFRNELGQINDTPPPGRGARLLFSSVGGPFCLLFTRGWTSVRLRFSIRPRASKSSERNGHSREAVLSPPAVRYSIDTRS